MVFVVLVELATSCEENEEVDVAHLGGFLTHQLLYRNQLKEVFLEIVGVCSD